MCGASLNLQLSASSLSFGTLTPSFDRRLRKIVTPDSKSLDATPCNSLVATTRGVNDAIETKEGLDEGEYMSELAAERRGATSRYSLTKRREKIRGKELLM